MLYSYILLLIGKVEKNEDIWNGIIINRHESQFY